MIEAAKSLEAVHRMGWLAGLSGLAELTEGFKGRFRVFHTLRPRPAGLWGRRQQHIIPYFLPSRYTNKNHITRNKGDILRRVVPPLHGDRLRHLGGRD